MLAELLASPAAQQCSAPILAARARVLLAAGQLAVHQGDRGTADRQCRELYEVGISCGRVVQSESRGGGGGEGERKDRPGLWEEVGEREWSVAEESDEDDRPAPAEDAVEAQRVACRRRRVVSRTGRSGQVASGIEASAAPPTLTS